MEIPELYQGIFEKAKNSKANAIKAKCLDCCQFFKPLITDCSVMSCPIRPHRPYQSKSLTIKKE